MTEIKIILNEAISAFRENAQSFLEEDCANYSSDEINLAILKSNQKQMMNICSLFQEYGKEFAEEFVKEIWENLRSRYWVGFQAMTYPQSPLYYRQEDGYISDQVIARTRKTKAHIKATDLVSFKEIFKHIAFEFAYEIDQEVIKDLMNNCGTIVKCEDNVNTILKTLVSLREETAKKIADFYEEDNYVSRLPNWIIMSYKRLSKLRLHDDEDDLSFDWVQSLEQKPKVYADVMFPENKILIGYKGNEFESGYIMAPYIMASFVERYQEDNKELFNEMTVSAGSPGRVTKAHYGILYRYGKKLINVKTGTDKPLSNSGGARFYSLLNIES